MEDVTGLHENISHFLWDFAICKCKSPWEILESVTREIVDGIRKHENYFLFESVLIKL